MKGLLRKIWMILRGTPARADECDATEKSALSEIRENMAMSEEALCFAEKNCRHAEKRYVYGEADETELSYARENLSKARNFFLSSLYELQSALGEANAGGRSARVS